jgi:hypothetical protein
MLFFTNIIHRFGVPNYIIMDNSTQFTGKKFLDFYDNHHIRVLWSVVAHPKTNDQVERANGMILQGLKPRIFDRLNKHGKKWVAELPSVLWGLRTTLSRAIGFTPFFLVYGAEAMLPTDLEYGSPRLRAYNEQGNDVVRENDLDQLEEARDIAYCTQRGISRISDATTTNTYTVEISTSETWCSDEAEAARDDTSFLHHGKDRTSSWRC